MTLWDSRLCIASGAEKETTNKYSTDLLLFSPRPMQSTYSLKAARSQHENLIFKIRFSPQSIDLERSDV